MVLCKPRKRNTYLIFHIEKFKVILLYWHNSPPPPPIPFVLPADPDSWIHRYMAFRIRIRNSSLRIRILTILLKIIFKKLKYLIQVNELLLPYLTTNFLISTTRPIRIRLDFDLQDPDPKRNLRILNPA